jgi:sterol desaturase/sphingolipid hydroxylase (fatty acid hydroxylase superfamily)
MFKIYFIFVIIFLSAIWVDGFPKLDNKYKVKQFKNVIFNIFFTTSFVIAYYITYIIPTKDIIKHIYRELFELFIDIIFSDIWFGSVHYTFHKFSFLYKNIHKKHHEIVYPEGWHALYAHPLDVFLTNIGSLIITHYFLCHSFIYCILIAFISVWNTILGAHTNKNPNGFHRGQSPSSHKALSITS